MDETGKFDDNDKRTGVWHWYHPNSTIASEYNYVDGILHGLYRVYQYSKEKKKILSHRGCYLNGRQTGFYYTYYSSGKICIQTNLLEGKNHGLYQSFYENGILCDVGKHTYGEKNGLWKNYHPINKKITQLYFYL